MAGSCLYGLCKSKNVLVCYCFPHLPMLGCLTLHRRSCEGNHQPLLCHLCQEYPGNAMNSEQPRGCQDAKMPRSGEPRLSPHSGEVTCLVFQPYYIPSPHRRLAPVLGPFQPIVYHRPRKPYKLEIYSRSLFFNQQDRWYRL